jgi:hypothetical protein
MELYDQAQKAKEVEAVKLIKLFCVGSLASAPTPEQNTGVLTARMLTALNALVGPGPSSFRWSPNGAALAYVEPRNRQDV